MPKPFAIHLATRSSEQKIPPLTLAETRRRALDPGRRRLLWSLQPLHYREEELPLHYQEEEVVLPSLPIVEKVLDEYRLLGLSTGEQLLSFYREALHAQGVDTVAERRTCAGGRPGGGAPDAAHRQRASFSDPGR